MGSFSSTANVVAQASDPGAIGPGAIWSETDSENIFRRNDANTDWVSISQLYGSATQGTSFPTTPSENDFFYRTDIKHTFVFNGTNWRSLIIGDEILNEYDEDFNSDIGWLIQDDTFINIETSTNERLDFNAQLDDTNDACSVPTTDSDFWSVAADNNKWALEFEIVFTTVTPGIDNTRKALYVGLCSATSATDDNSSVDFLGMELQLSAVANLWQTLDCDAETLTAGQNGADIQTIATGSTFIVQMIREASDQFHLKILNSSRVLQSEDIRTIDNPVSLDNFGVWNRKAVTAGSDAVLIGHIDNLKCFNGLSLI